MGYTSKWMFGEHIVRIFFIVANKISKELHTTSGIIGSRICRSSRMDGGETFPPFQALRL